jgi:hypothetical protein
LLAKKDNEYWGGDLNISTPRPSYLINNTQYVSIFTTTEAKTFHHFLVPVQMQQQVHQRLSLPAQISIPTAASAVSPTRLPYKIPHMLKPFLPTRNNFTRSQ